MHLVPQRPFLLHGMVAQSACEMVSVARDIIDPDMLIATQWEFEADVRHALWCLFKYRQELGQSALRGGFRGLHLRIVVSNLSNVISLGRGEVRTGSRTGKDKPSGGEWC